MVMISFGGLLSVALLALVGYGVLSWIFGGNKPLAANPGSPQPLPARGAPAWITPMVLIGMVVVGLRSGMTFWVVVLGSVFLVVMLVKLNVLSFGEAPRPASSVPPPLPPRPQPRFQDATYHPTFAPPPRPRSGFRALPAIACVLLVLCLAGGGVSWVHEMRQMRTPATVEMVATEGWREAMQEVNAEFRQGMHEFRHGAHEMAQDARVMAHEVANATREATRAMPGVPSPPPAAPPAAVIIRQGPPADAPLALPPGAIVSPAIPPTEPERINKVLGRQQNGKGAGGQKPKREPKNPPANVERVLAVRVDHNRTKDELAAFPTDKAPNGQYVLLTDPDDSMDSYHEAYDRALVLLKNHLAAAHPETSGIPDLNLPPQSWAEANGLVHRRVEPLEGGRGVLALGANFSPKAVELAYNYHLGCVRTREAAKGYFGGLLVLGGLGLLLRIGTGVRPTPLPKA